ncbi:hypothetical protein QBC36DRAFT_142104 [Triangularia setosa]|uniref:Uncharacterized protein n=1 Tax=Triangularia setosa TaxID=2587417 RepID=A0AAN6W816_9PEZI|nr:hypothetical protein QBC36DRAFT_142104 [Podospora setosa]
MMVCSRAWNSVCMQVYICGLRNQPVISYFISLRFVCVVLPITHRLFFVCRQRYRGYRGTYCSWASSVVVDVGVASCVHGLLLPSRLANISPLCPPPSPETSRFVPNLAEEGV